MTPEPVATTALFGADTSEPSLLELVDHLLDKGCLITGELVLGLADVDLIYCELSVILCAVDRIQKGGRDE